MDAHLATYTDEQLRAAWRVCKLDSWPPTFDAAMADAQYSRLVRLNAWRLVNPRHQRQPARPPAPQPRRWLQPMTPLPAGWVDHKRAAAGDRDD